MKTTTALVCLSLPLLCAPSVSADILRTVALTGYSAPGTGEDFLNFGTPVLNDAGLVVFNGYLTGPGVTGDDNQGIWSEGAGEGLALIARWGDAAPGTGIGVNFSRFNTASPVLNDAGETAFRGFLTGAFVNSGNDSGIWSEGGGTGLALIAREGDAAPGTGIGVNFLSFANAPPVLNDAGETAFRGLLTGAFVNIGNNLGVWSEGGGTGLALIARKGNQAPGTSVGVGFSGFNNPALNEAGQTAFYGTLTGPGVDDSNSSGIWSEGAGGGLALVAREGDMAPGTGIGVNFSEFDFSVSPPDLNDTGQVAFAGSLAGAFVNSGNNSGIWSEGGGHGLALVARKGNQAPGASIGVGFSSLGKPVLNKAGQTAFHGRLAGPGVDSSNNQGIWSEGGGGELELVARTGDAAPGTSSGVNFQSFGSPSINSAGQTVFFGFLAGTGVDNSNSLGYWAEDPSGVLKLIARQGDLLDVDDGPGTDFRTIVSLWFVEGSSGNDDGRPSGLNDLGQIAFRTLFTDGTSGIFVSNLVAVSDLPGDYNADGVVDAADYTVWRDNLGSTNFLPNDTTPGTVTEADYTVWKENFGALASAAATVATNATNTTVATNATVPEPATAMLMVLASIAASVRRRWGASHISKLIAA